MYNLDNSRRLKTLWIYDLLFLCGVGLYAWLTLIGNMELSAQGALIDPDLQTYAQGMAGENGREFFQADPVLGVSSSANSIPNLQRLLATFLAPELSSPEHNQKNWAAGLLRSGAMAIFFFYAFWYALGRYLFRSPVLAAILSLCSGITIWVGWGTFWGVTHSDPVPRVFFAAIMPLLLILLFNAIQKPWLRPVTMFCSGLCMWVHGVSALNFGAMAFMVFLFIRPKSLSLKSQIFNLILCVIFFGLPVVLFLGSSLIQKTHLTYDDLAVFREVLETRWRKDFYNIAPRLLAYFSWRSPAFPVFIFGMIGWFIVRLLGTEREKMAAKIYPPAILGLVCVTFFCWLESTYAFRFERVPMGHELVRGLRFLIPLAWIMIVAGTGCILGVWLRRLLLAGIIVLLCAFTTDKQFIGAKYAIAKETGWTIAKEAASVIKEAQEQRKLFEMVRQLVPEGQAVFAWGDAMPIRYISFRPLDYSFKDGYVFFYNKDRDGARKWLEKYKLVRSPAGFIEAWGKSDAPWLLCPASWNKNEITRYGQIVKEEYGWILARKT